MDRVLSLLEKNTNHIVEELKDLNHKLDELKKNQDKLDLALNKEIQMILKEVEILKYKAAFLGSVGAMVPTIIFIAMEYYIKLSN